LPLSTSTTVPANPLAPSASSDATPVITFGNSDGDYECTDTPRAPRRPAWHRRQLHRPPLCKKRGVILTPLRIAHRRESILPPPKSGTSPPPASKRQRTQGIMPL
jgi:hypothetical protein